MNENVPVLYRHILNIFRAIKNRLRAVFMNYKYLQALHVSESRSENRPTALVAHWFSYQHITLVLLASSPNKRPVGLDVSTHHQLPELITSVEILMLPDNLSMSTQPQN